VTGRKVILGGDAELTCELDDGSSAIIAVPTHRLNELRRLVVEMARSALNGPAAVPQQPVRDFAICCSDALRGHVGIHFNQNTDVEEILWVPDEGAQMMAKAIMQNIAQRQPLMTRPKIIMPSNGR